MTKPCARADRGCTELIEAPTARALEVRKFCTLHCAYLHRVESGTWPAGHVLTTEERARGGRKGAHAAAAKRKARALRRAVSHVVDLIPADLDDKLDSRDRVRMRLLMARALRRGVQLERHRRRRPVSEETRDGH